MNAVFGVDAVDRYIVTIGSVYSQDMHMDVSVIRFFRLSHAKNGKLGGKGRDNCEQGQKESFEFDLIPFDDYLTAYFPFF